MRMKLQELRYVQHLRTNFRARRKRALLLPPRFLHTPLVDTLKFERRSTIFYTHIILAALVLAVFIYTIIDCQVYV